MELLYRFLFKQCLAKYKKRGMLQHSSLFCKFITQIHQETDLLILQCPIQRNGEPMALIHMLVRADKVMGISTVLTE